MAGGPPAQALPSYLDIPLLPCSATKIGPTAILTAAHCVSGWGGEQVTIAYIYQPGIRLGIRGAFTADGNFAVASPKIASVTVHPSWISGLKKARNTTLASFDPEVSDLAVVEIEPSEAFAVFPSAAVNFASPEVGQDIVQGGLSRQNDATIHTASKRIEAIDPAGYQAPRENEDGQLAILEAGDSGGAVYDKKWSNSRSRNR
jgi:hypothetical protein